MSNSKRVSLILFTNSGNENLEQQRRETNRVFGQCHLQVLVVNSENSVSRGDADITRDVPGSNGSFSNVQEAIASAKHPLVAFADESSVVNSILLQSMLDQADKSSIQTTFSPPRINRKFKWLLFEIFAILVRLILRIRKSELHGGVTLFQRDEAMSLANQLRGHDSGPLVVTKLLALAKLNKRSVTEITIHDLKCIDGSGEPNSGAIFNATANMIQFWWNDVMFPQQQISLPPRKIKSLPKFGAITALMLLSIFMLFNRLDYPLFEPDEARNAQLALTIVETGDWMSLSLGDENYWDKPPLQMWAIAATYRFFGISQQATRFPGAIASLLTIALVLLVGKRLVGFHAAMMGACLLLLTTGFIVSGRYVTMDASLTLAATATFLWGFLFVNNRSRKKYAIAMGIACGIGLLIKGPVIIVLCMPPIVVANWLSRQISNRHVASGVPQNIAKHSWMWVVVPALLIAAPWYLATAIIHPDFVTYFFWKHHVVRFSNAFNHREPFWYYLVGIFLFMFPASCLIPSVTKFITSRKPENRLVRTTEHGFLLLSVVWIIGFFSMSESKLPAYIMPSFPLVCLLMGVMLEQKIFRRSASVSNTAGPFKVLATYGQMDGGRHRPTFLERLPKRASWSIAFTIVVFLVVMAFVLKTNVPSLVTLVIIGITLIGFMLVAVSNKPRQKIVWASFGLVSLLFVSVATHHLLPAISVQRSIHLAAKSIQDTPEFENAPVVFFGRESYGAELKLSSGDVFYFESSQAGAVAEFLSRYEKAIIVASGEPMETLRHELPWTISLEQFPDARHIYLSRPNKSVIAQIQNTSTTPTFTR